MNRGLALLRVRSLVHGLAFGIALLAAACGGGTALLGLVAPDSSSSPPQKNSPPVVTIRGDVLVANRDQRGALPIPLAVLDSEGDPVRVVVQWRRGVTDFPTLPTDEAAIDAVLADPVKRRDLQIATEFPQELAGRIASVDPRTLRLLGLASVRPAELVGEELEILRPRTGLARVASGWTPGATIRPTSVLPLGSGPAVLVLADMGGGSWNLVELDLATGQRTDVVPAQPGTPTVMDFGAPGGTVVVASHDGNGLWRLDRVDREAKTVTELADGTLSSETGPVRGLAVLGENAALITVASSVVRVEYFPGERSRAVTLLTGLATPWGIAVDPIRANGVFFAERDTAGNGRIVSFALDSLELRNVLAPGVVGSSLVERPEALVVENGGRRLLVSSQASAGARQVVAVDLDSADPEPISVVETGFPDDGASLAAGPDGLRVRTLVDDLAVAGGIAQVREISAVTAKDEVVVDRDFAPLLTSANTWRIERLRGGRLAPNTNGVFVWDTSDVEGGGRVFLRATGLDGSVGPSSDSTLSKEILPTFAGPVRTLSDAGAGEYRDVEARDVDGDGFLDLLAANRAGDRMGTVFFQDAQGLFELRGEDSSLDRVIPPNDFSADGLRALSRDLDHDGLDEVVIAVGDLGLVVFVQNQGGQEMFRGEAELEELSSSVLALDLLGDGDLELVATETATDRVSVSEVELGSIGTGAPAAILTDPRMEEPRSVASVDFDGDGVLDLITANAQSHNLALFSLAFPVTSSTSAFAILEDGAIPLDPVDLAVADLNGDGGVDVVCANPARNDLALFFSVKGSFSSATQPTSLGGPATSAAPAAVVVADVDGDGDLDLLSANEDGDDVAVFLQQSAGVFISDPVSLGGPGITDGPTGLDVADLDLDGHVEICVANTTGQNLVIFEPTVPGSFGGDSLSLDDPGLANGPQDVLATDLDSDGDLDVACANADGGDLTLLFQSGPGIIDVEQRRLDDPSLLAPSDLAAGDLDGDGRIDLVCANGGGNALTVFLQPSTSDGFRKGAPAVRLLQDDFDSEDVAIIDLNDDGLLDVVSASQSGQDLAVFLQPLGGFPPSKLPDAHLPDVKLPVSLVAVDLDGDTDADLVSANFQTDDVRIHRQDADGNFRSPEEFGGGGESEMTDVIVTDLDGDGALDVVAANRGSESLAVYLDPKISGVPTFLVTDVAMIEPQVVAAADLDEDGDRDLVSGNGAGLDTLFLQVAPRRFVLSSETATGPSDAIAIADLDGDMDLDLIGVERSADRLRVFFGGH